MLSISKENNELYEIKKSKFLSFACPVFSEEDAQKIISEKRKKYSDATHVCYAYVIDSPKIEKASDDGEPVGTAGKPMLELIKKKKISNVLLIVVRYFGGIKLGAGGLVRAYTSASNLVLSNAEVVDFIAVNKYSATVHISEGNKLINYISSIGGEVLKCVFEEKTYVEFIADIDLIKSKFNSIEIVLIGSEIRCQ